MKFTTSAILLASSASLAVAHPGRIMDLSKQVAGQAVEVAGLAGEVACMKAACAIDSIVGGVAGTVINHIAAPVAKFISGPMPSGPYKANSTVNEINECRPVTVLFARGTFDAGNIGELVGPPFLNSVANKLGAKNVGAAGILPYAASFLGYVRGKDPDPVGSSSLGKMTANLAKACPDTQIVWSGWSQGAQLIHVGSKSVPSEIAKRVKAVVLFGDPMNGERIQNIDPKIVRVFCYKSDPLCWDTGKWSVSHYALTLQHFWYGDYHDEAANFVASMVKASMGTKSAKTASADPKSKPLQKSPTMKSSKGKRELIEVLKRLSRRQQMEYLQDLHERQLYELD